MASESHASTPLPTFATANLVEPQQAKDRHWHYTNTLATITKMKIAYYNLLVFLLLASANLVAQKKLISNDSINFKMDGFNSSYELTLCSDNTFRFNYTMVGCIVTVDECGNQNGPFVDNGTIHGNFTMEDFKLTFNPEDGDEYLLNEPFFILPLKDQAYLISSKKREINRIREWREDFDEPFPQYLIRMNETGIFHFFHSVDKIILSPENKKKVFEIFK